MNYDQWKFFQISILKDKNCGRTMYCVPNLIIANETTKMFKNFTI